MKLRITVFISTLCLIVAFSVTWMYVRSLKYNACDIPKVNDTYKNMVSDLKKYNISAVEKKYSCKIIKKNEADYTNSVYQAIKNGNVMIDYMNGDRLEGKIIFPVNSDSFLRVKKNLSVVLWSLFASIIIILYTVVFIIYNKVIRPFHRMKSFADNIAVGNLDIPLTMDKENYFGAFTESFDMMREELKKARQGEFEAQKSKKELVAGLSHDIKTPVSTIKALCEIMEIKLSDSDALTKIHTINQKADVIDKLISNMFHATLEELEVLKIEPTEELSTILPPMFSDANLYDKIHIKKELPECLIYCDKLRLNQVIDNIINNSYKYADTDIDVTYSEQENYITIEIRDYGKNVPEGELPLVFEKFYRGENAASHSGSGLGLYLAKQFMKGMMGEIECFCDHGFVVILTIKKV